MSQSKNQSRVQAEIDANLKRAYQDVLNEAVPDRFAQLLAQLKDKNSPDGGGHDSQS